MPAVPSTIRAHWPAYAALAALFLLSGSAFTLRAYDSLDLLWHAREYARPPFYLGDANWGAVVVQPEAEVKGMKFGDAVLSVNGRPVDGFVVYYGLLRHATSGDRLQVQVQSPGDGSGIRNLSIELRAYQSASDPPIGFSEYLGTALRMVALPVVCLALGFWVAAVRIGDRSAWLFLVLLIGLPATFGGGAPEMLFGRGNVLQPLLAGFSVLSSQAALPALMLFGIAFPERLPLDRRFPWLKWIVAGYLLLVAGLVAIAVGLWLHHVELARRLTGRPIILLTGLEGDFGAAVGGLAVVICAVSLGWKAMTAPSRDARRRLMLLFAGAAPGATAQSQIQAAMSVELLGVEAGLVAYWRFNEASGTTSSDDSPANHSATLTIPPQRVAGGPAGQ